MCTNLVLKFVGDGSAEGLRVFGARCLELSGSIPTSLYWVPRSNEWKTGGSLADGTPIAWTNSFGFTGVAIPPGPKMSGYVFMDGMNDVGLSVGALWLPGTAYPQVPRQKSGSYLWFTDLTAWLLGNFRAVADAQAALKEITVCGPPTPPPGGSDGGYVPLHYIVTDRTGQSLVIEFVDGVMTTYGPDYRKGATSDGVLTNAPTYDWQRTNLENYTNLSVVGATTSISNPDAPPVGAGLVGLPGDTTSPSRFVRAAKLRQGFDLLAPTGNGWLPAPNGTGEVPQRQAFVTLAMQLVQTVMETPYGTNLAVAQSGQQYPTVGDWTMWSVVRDQVNLVYYYTTAFNGVMRSVNLAQLPKSGSAPYQAISMLPDQYASQWSVDVTADLQPAAR